MADATDQDLAQLIARAIETERARARGPGGIYDFAASGRPGITPYLLDLSVARDNVELNIPGRVLSVVDATDGTAEATVRFSQQMFGRQGLPLKRGIEYKVPFWKLWISNTAQAGKTLVLAISEEIEFSAINQNLALINRVDEVPWLNFIPSGYKLDDVSGVIQEDAAATETTIYTVPAGKVDYVEGMTYHGLINGQSNTPVTITMDIDGLTWIVGRWTTSNTTGTRHEFTGDRKFQPLVKLPAGSTIKISKPVASDAIEVSFAVYKQQ